MTAAEPHGARWGGWLWVAIIGYVAMLGLIVGSLDAAREWALSTMATPKSVDQWEAWREDVRRQQDDQTPVRRRIPKSAEPPTLVLMRDFYAATLGGAILFMSVLYWVTAWLAAGMLTTPSQVGDARNARPGPTR